MAISDLKDACKLTLVRPSPFNRDQVPSKGVGGGAEPGLSGDGSSSAFCSNLPG